MTDKVFIEKQRFSQLWLWVIIFGLFIFLLWDQIYWFYIWLTLEHTPEKFPIRWIDLFTTLTALGLISLFFFSRLETHMDKNGIKVTFWPLLIKQKFIRWDEIDEVFIRRYKPMDDYGGWGIKRGYKGKVYNTSGNMGLQLFLKSGEKLLIGTQKYKELEEFLKLNIYDENWIVT